MTRKAKPAALPPIVPGVLIPYVSPDQFDQLLYALHGDYWPDGDYDVLCAAIALFGADTTDAQYVALDKLRAALLDLIFERPVDDPRGAGAAPPTDPADGGEVVVGPAVFAGMGADDAAELFKAVSDADGAAACERCHAPARDMCACDGDAGTAGAT